MFGLDDKPKVYACWKCGHTIDMDDGIQRTDECPSCMADLHVCKNCRFWDPGAHNECRENVASYVRDRDQSNFCMAFVFKAEDEDVAAEANDARSKLEAMFKNLK